MLTKQKDGVPDTLAGRITAGELARRRLVAIFMGQRENAPVGPEASNRGIILCL